MKKYWPFIIVAAVIVVLGAIFAQSQPGVKDVGGGSDIAETEVVYHCENDNDINATFMKDPDQVVIEAEGMQPVALSRAQSGSGARYADGEAELWEHQGVARIRVGNASFDHCVPEKS
jgi:membrane-bound inhibitor of C-type lysozyme